MNAAVQKISDAVWDEIKLGFCAGKPVEFLSKHYGVKEATIYKRSKRQNWRQQRQRFRGEIDEYNHESFEHAKDAFKHNVAASFEKWLADTEQLRLALSGNNIEDFNTLVSAFTKLVMAGQKHFNIGESGEIALVVAGVITDRPEADAITQPIEIDSSPAEANYG
jgi:5'-3' exonuclease